MLEGAWEQSCECIYNISKSISVLKMPRSGGNKVGMKLENEAGSLSDRKDEAQIKWD